MAKVIVTESHSLSTDDAVDRLAVFEQMVSKFGVSLKWKGTHADFKGLGVSGTIDVSESDATIELKLGMMAKAAGIDGDRLKSSISKRVREAFDA
tara:strand:- start:99 stop:383 length:285 start_codon:yes stop_codon:yes gene_type:complete